MHTRTDNVKTVYPPQTKFAGGINICLSGLYQRYFEQVTGYIPQSGKQWQQLCDWPAFSVNHVNALHSLVYHVNALHFLSSHENGLHSLSIM